MNRFGDPDLESRSAIRARILAAGPPAGTSGEGNMIDIHEGGCVCGNVRYRAVGEPVLATVCHCKFCQKRTGSAFSQPVVFKAEQVEFSGGPRTTYEHRSDETQRWLRMQFCPRCGTTVAWQAERRPGTLGISAGT